MLLALCFIWYGMTVVVNLFHFNYIMNADLASEGILARLIWEKKQWVPDTWYVATELQLIFTPQLAAVLYGITNNMNLSMGLACSIISFAILGTIAYFCKKVKMDSVPEIVMVFLCLMLPATFSMLELTYLFVGYYAEHIITFFLTLSVYAILLRNIKEKGIYLKMGLCLFLALILGLQGTRGILVIYGPLFGIEVIRLLFVKYSKGKIDASNLRTLVFSILLLIISYLGTLSPLSVGQNISRNIRNGLHKLWVDVIPDNMRAIGFAEGHILRNICLAVIVVCVLAQIVGILINLLKRKEILPIQWCFLVVAASPVVAAIMVSFTTVESSERYYFMWIFSMAYSIVMLWINVKKKGFKIILMAAVVILAVINAKDIYMPIFATADPPHTDAYDVVIYLEENNLSVAYSTFENANKMTALSNGKVNVYAVDSMKKMNECKWMTSTEWYPPEMPYHQKTAYIVPEVFEDDFGKFIDAGADCELVNKIGCYSIWVSEYNYTMK